MELFAEGLGLFSPKVRGIDPDENNTELIPFSPNCDRIGSLGLFSPLVSEQYFGPFGDIYRVQRKQQLLQPLLSNGTLSQDVYVPCKLSTHAMRMKGPISTLQTMAKHSPTLCGNSEEMRYISTAYLVVQ